MLDQTIASKKCSKCGETKPLSEFHKARTAKDGHAWYCKACNNACGRRRYAANPEKVCAAARRYRQANPEKVAIAAQRRREANLEKEKTRQRRYYEANRERFAANSQRYYGANREKLKIRRRQYYQAHLEQARAYGRQYRREHPEVSRAADQRRRARKMDLPHDLTARQWQKTLFAFGHRCAYCGEVAHPDNCPVHGCLVREHVVAMTSGGGYVFGNIVPACERCNNSKFMADHHDWMQRSGYAVEAFESILGKLASPPTQSACQSHTIS